jgi:hypothetical protein
MLKISNRYGHIPVTFLVAAVLMAGCSSSRTASTETTQVKPAPIDEEDRTSGDMIVDGTQANAKGGR